MKEFDIKLVGNDEEIKNEEIFNDFDINYVPINNLPISYFPLNNGLLSYELKKVNNEDLTSGEALEEIELTIDASNSPYTILVKKNINCKLNLSGTLKDIRLNKGIYTIIFDINGYNIIEKNKKEIYKELKRDSASIILNFIDATNSSNVKKISSNNGKGIDLINSSGHSLETAIDNPNYKLIVYRTFGSTHTLKLNKDIICDILLVGGGGYGGWLGGGGGGGGVVYKHNYLLRLGQYEISIGEGGTNNNGYIGKNTLIKKHSSNILGAGGGGNGGLRGSDGSIITYNSETNSGGGGGGGGNNENGNSGNNISGNGGKNNGGGGGAGGNGNNGVNNNGGNGGNGIKNNITGEEKYYGGGGGGSGRRINNGIKGIGVHGGGNGSDYNIRANSGDSGTGGGGGGQGQESEVSTNESYIAGFGGSGIVIIRVKHEDIDNDINNDEILTSYDTRIINEINNLLEKKMIEFNNDEKPYNYLGIYPLVILIIIFWIFIFLFLLKFVHHYFTSIYIYILLFIIIFLLIVGSFWFLYTNNDIL